MKKTISSLSAVTIIAIAALCVASCSNKKFNVNGTIANAKDSLLYFENVGLDGPEVVDSVKLGDDGTFAFSEKSPEAPEFYRLRIAGQIINVSIDSTETVSVKAEYPSMSYQYEISGSENCSKIKELSLLQIQLQTQINDIVSSPNFGVDSANVIISNLVESYKTKVKSEYIFKEPMKAYSYFALFQTIVLGGRQMLIFNPRNNENDVKVFGAVATSWDTYYPKALRGENLHNITIEGMKNIRIMRNQQSKTIDANKVNTSGIIDIALPDNKGNIRKLTDLKGKVVLLDFHVFASENSLKRIMSLRELYNKYHAQGFEIYQISIDADEHFWKTSTAALPWISVRDEDGTRSANLMKYNVQSIPTFYLIGRDNTIYKRDAQVSDLDATIKSML